MSWALVLTLVLTFDLTLDMTFISGRLSFLRNDRITALIRLVN